MVRWKELDLSYKLCFNFQKVYDLENGHQTRVDDNFGRRNFRLAKIGRSTKTRRKIQIDTSDFEKCGGMILCTGKCVRAGFDPFIASRESGTRKKQRRQLRCAGHGPETTAHLHAPASRRPLGPAPLKLLT